VVEAHRPAAPYAPAVANPPDSTAPISREAQGRWDRPRPTIGDRSSAAERGADPRGWAFSPPERDALARIVAARRDIRRYRPDPVDEAVLARVLAAAHAGPSVGHSQPWRFVVVADPATRARAALLADRCRLAQAAQMTPEAGRHLLDLDLEGIREAPLGLIVCCDRRVPPAGVLGRATFADADMWSCACAIENLWLTARAEGLGIGWVTLFEPDDLRQLVGAPAGVVTLGWLCVGWPDERPPAPGLERRGWSVRQPLDEIVLQERWPSEAGPAVPSSRITAPAPFAVVAAHDSGDRILAPPGALGVLDRAVDRILAIAGPAWPAAGGPTLAGSLLLAAADHPVTIHGVSAYPPAVTREVAAAAVAGESVGAVAARTAGLDVVVVDAGIDGPPLPGALLSRPCDPKGDLLHTDALSRPDCDRVLAAGSALASALVPAAGRSEGSAPVVALGEIGVGNTTVAAALASALLQLPPERVVGLGAGSDTEMVRAKCRVVTAAVARTAAATVAAGGRDPISLLAALGGGEIAFLAGAVLGAARAGAVIVLDGMATSVAALVALDLEPAAGAHLVAGQRSRELGHPAVLAALGLEPLLDLRLRAGEGAGAAMAVSLLRAALEIRRTAAATGTERG
jgi:nicotinate-nucleotide--dimethylbenzimidazole phosphoribosyltransferase